MTAEIHDSAILPNHTVHGDTNFRCTSNIAIFYITNYFAHCATVKMMPGESAISSFVNAVMVFFFPTFGIMRAVSAIVRHARFTRKDEVWIATRAGALCMLVRSRHWKPQDGDVVRQCRTRSSQKSINSWNYEFSSQAANDSEPQDRSGLLERLPIGSIPMSVWDPRWMAELLPVVGSQRIYPSRHKVHGRMIIPEGYRLAHIPSDAEVVPLARNTDLSALPSQWYGTLLGISSNYNLPKAVVAIVQTVYAAITLYRSRDDQIDHFGYAAFGLTVTPYIVMSIFNLLAQIATPDYKTLFLVKSDIMTEAEGRGGVFDGAIGELVHEPIAEPDPRSFSAIIRKEGNSDSFQLEPSVCCLVPDSEAGLSGVSPPLSATTIPIRKFFPFRPKRHGNKFEARGYTEWLYVPSCTPFRRSSAVTDGTVHVPQDSRKYSSKNFLHDKADIGYLKNESIPERRHWLLFRVLIPLGISLVSILVYGILSRFRQGKSTKMQRVWIMSWLIVGMALAPVGSLLGALFTDFLAGKWSGEKEKDGVIAANFGIIFTTLGMLLVIGILFVPAVGGLVVVGEMIKQHEHCIRI
ncbi:hypothetical protein V2W45_1446273, partial [Cenococcum geophilum]